MSDRWHGFKPEELNVIAGALRDSGGMRSDLDWYNQCHALRLELIVSAALAKARGEQPDAPK